MNKDGFEITPESGSNNGSINVKANDTGFIISGDTAYGFRFYMV